MDLAQTLHEQGGLDESEAFIGGMFSAAKGGGADIGHSKRGKGVRVMGIVDGNGLPLSVSTHAANHHEVTLVQLTLWLHKNRAFFFSGVHLVTCGAL